MPSIRYLLHLGRARFVRFIGPPCAALARRHLVLKYHQPTLRHFLWVNFRLPKSALRGPCACCYGPYARRIDRAIRCPDIGAPLPSPSSLPPQSPCCTFTGTNLPLRTLSISPMHSS